MVGDTLEHEKEVNKDKLEYVQAVTDRHYATDNAQALWDNKVEREQALDEERNAGNKKDKLQARRKIRNTRKKDVETIKRDWMENQPEKYALHLIKEISRYEKMLKNAKTEKEQEEYSKKINKILKNNKKWMSENSEVMNLVMDRVEKEKENEKSKTNVPFAKNMLSEDEKKDRISRAKLRIASKKDENVDDKGCKTVELKPKYKKSAKLDKKQETRIVSMYTSNIEKQKRA